jgi:hypothetical protein
VPSMPATLLPESSNPVARAMDTWGLAALIVLASLIQLFASIPGGSSQAKPYSLAKCVDVFPHTEEPTNFVAASVVEDFRYRCERGLTLPR